MEIETLEAHKHSAFLRAVPDNTRIWIYQSERKLSDSEAALVKPNLEKFISNWASHSIDLMAVGALVLNGFIVLGVDESAKGASGCSIDSSVHFIRQISQAIQVDFMNRMIFSYWQHDELKFATRDHFSQLYASGDINDDTIVFDTLVKNKESFVSGFAKRLGDSWHIRMV